MVLVHRQLVAEMAQDLVGWCSEKVGQVFGEDFASDLVMVADGGGCV